MHQSLSLNIPPLHCHLHVETGSTVSFLPSFLQREGCLIQVQARVVLKSRRQTSGSRTASSSIVPARKADKSEDTREQGGGVGVGSGRGDRWGGAFPRHQAAFFLFGAIYLGL